ncbi:hypothetical protein GGR52DRAFT_559877 [Hypoxylon sp. FL1284]|nr:hypothetical protein GGR52DRAFT_559877 [Hypoxylon sp. FL1284]
MSTPVADLAVEQGNSGASSLPSNQKRSRDYGEELKGLPTSEDEAGDSASHPSWKKQKVDHIDRADHSDMDDGEIVEPSPAPDSGAAPETKEPVGDAAVHDFSEDGEVGSSAAEPEEASVPAEPFFIDRVGSKPATRPGWNDGVSLGTRVSFGGSGTRLFPANSPAAAPAGRDNVDGRENGGGGGDDNAEDGGKNEQGEKTRKRTKSINTTFTTGDASPVWKFPIGPAVSVQQVDDASNPAYWVDKLRSWAVALLNANKQISPDRLKPDVIRTGVLQQYSGRPNLFHGRKTKKNEFVSVAKKVLITINLQALVADVRRIHAEAANASWEKTNIASERSSPEIVEDTASPPVSDRQDDDGDDDELQQQRKYFPGAEDPSRYCLSCCGIGHKARECPLRRCKFCESLDHVSFGCPTKRRCSNCGKVGHTAGICDEDVGVAGGEPDPCAFCDGDHIEEKCSEIWKTFVPTPETHTKVNDIPAFCCKCGAKGHYDLECPLLGRGKVRGKTTWSEANRLLYVDADSPNTAIGWVDVEPPSSPNEEFHIRAMARRPTHTHFVSSDESEGEDLVHAPIQRPGPRGEIRIATNISSAPIGQGFARSGAKGTSRKKGDFAPPPPPLPQPGQNSRSSSWKPPLPPGPPPSLPNNVFQGSLPSAALASLPARPQTGGSGSQQSRGGGRGFYRGSSHGKGGPYNNRGGRGGGGRGNGRGRGRGRGN